MPVIQTLGFGWQAETSSLDEPLPKSHQSSEASRCLIRVQTA
jgi:hypothetical protein